MSIKSGDRVEIFSHWSEGRPIRMRPSVEGKVLSVDGDVVTVFDECGDGGQARYSKTTGRRLDAEGSPHPWDFWRLRLDS